MSILPAINIFKKINIRGVKKSQAVPEQVWQNPLYFIGFGFGSGCIPFAPGTFGTLMAIPFYLALRLLPLSYYLIALLFITIFASWLCSYLSRQIASHDHPGMCIDEFVGFFVTMINAPAGWGWILLGFILFRLFDIWKPWPISYLDEKVHGGFGMVLDDVVAGIFACAIIQLVGFLL